METDYVPLGPEDRQCASCINFRPQKDDPNEGICFGRTVTSHGSCKFFKEKKTW